MIYLVVVLSIGILFALFSGFWPKSIIGWSAVLIFGLPAVLLGEFLGEKLFSNKISNALDKNQKNKLISIRRMAYALIVGIITTIIIVFLGYLLKTYFGAHFTIQ